MDVALDILNRALQGEVNARSFLDRTCSIYILDVTDASNPKTYGCWNFIHSALNEVERMELLTLKQQQQQHSNSHTLMMLTHHVQLLTTMSLRVARRSPQADHQLVATCISNAYQDKITTLQQQHTTSLYTQTQTLTDANFELRDICIGRIAALAFDHAFHKPPPPTTTSNHNGTFTATATTSSVFSNPQVMQQLCAIVAANAVSSGSIHHLVTDWIVPSAQTLPPFALASVTESLAYETLQSWAPAGTQDMLQRLSTPIMATVLAPVFMEALQESIQNNNNNNSGGGSSISSYTTTSNKELIAATCLRAMDKWCAATDLSLAQIKHICSKVQINIVSILSDAMYSDSRVIIEALADWIEAVVHRHDFPIVSQERMTQVRYIMQVDEVSFRTNTSPQQLILIESKEMETILQELMSAIGLQRFRFVHRQSTGDHDVCRSLTRIAAAICMAVIHANDKLVVMGATSNSREPLTITSGIVELLVKAAGHPSVNICGIAIPALTHLMERNNNTDDTTSSHSTTTFCHDLLQILQRRAIIPHHVIVDNHTPNGANQQNSATTCSLAATDLCGVNAHEFDNFRETVLTDALLACWRHDGGDHYVASCTSAIEEFCSSSGNNNNDGSSSSSPPPNIIQESFHLEAALFCMGAVADEAFGNSASTTSTTTCTTAVANNTATAMITSSSSVSSTASTFAHGSYLERCTTALAKKPQGLTTNPLTLAQMCRFLQKYNKWYATGNMTGGLDVATELALSTFSLSSTDFPTIDIYKEMKRESSFSPFTESAIALREILTQSPQHFLSNQAIAALGGAWEASYAATNRVGIISVEDRQALCVGICHVLASLPDSQRSKSLHALALPALDCLETMTQLALNKTSALPVMQQQEQGGSEQVGAILNRLSHEIIIITTMSRTFTNAFAIKDMESGCRTSDGHAAIVEPAFAIIRKAWPSIKNVASQFNNDSNVSRAIGTFLVECIPPECQDNQSLNLLKELCSIALSMLQSTARIIDSNDISSDTTTAAQFQPVLNFLQVFVKIHGEVVDKNALASLEGRTTPSNAERGREIGTCLESLLLSTVDAVQNSLGATWAGSERQGQGQPAFESKSERIDHTRISNEALSGMFTLLRTCAERCPIFLLHLPAAAGMDRNEDMLHRRAVESAVAALMETDVDTCKCAMEYLESSVKLTQSFSNDVRQVAAEIISRVESNIITMLLVGACGKINPSTLPTAASLLVFVLLSSASPREERESTLIQALRNDSFMLGNQAKTVSLAFLQKVQGNMSNVQELQDFLESIWKLHQVEFSDSLDGSDAVSRFCTKFSSQ